MHKQKLLVVEEKMVTMDTSRFHTFSCVLLLLLIHNVKNVKSKQRIEFI